MDIYILLKKDHEHVKKLLKVLEKSRDDKVLKELNTEVYVHSEAEEKVFYSPLRRRAGDLKVIIGVGEDEHKGVEKMLEKLATIKDEQDWHILFSAIKNGLESHIASEEDIIFSISKQHFSATEAKQMAEDMLVEKERLKKKM